MPHTHTIYAHISTPLPLLTHCTNPNSPFPHARPSRLSAPTPHPLQIPIPLRQAVHAVVALAHGAHEPAQRVHLVLARVPPVLIHLADGDLHGAVVLGLDDAVRGGALAGDVAGCSEGEEVSVVLLELDARSRERGVRCWVDWVGRTGRRARRVRSPWLRCCGCELREVVCLDGGLLIALVVSRRTSRSSKSGGIGGASPQNLGVVD